MCDRCRIIAARILPQIFTAATISLLSDAQAQMVEARQAEDKRAEEHATHRTENAMAIGLIAEISDALNKTYDDGENKDMRTVIGEHTDPLDTFALQRATRTAFYTAELLLKLARELNQKSIERAIVGDVDAAKFVLTDTGREITLQRDQARIVSRGGMPNVTAIVAHAMSDAAGEGDFGAPPSFQH